MKLRKLFAIAAIACSPGAWAAPTADVIIIVDESISMRGEHAWIGQMVLDLDTALVGAGITGNRYGLVGYVESNGAHSGLPAGTCNDPLAGQGNPARCPGPHKHGVGGDTQDFGTAGELDTAAGTLSTAGSAIEDGMEAIDYALANYAFRNDAAVNLILITDENMEIASPTNPATNQANLNAKNALLNVVVGGVAGLNFRDAGNNALLGVDANGDGYRADGMGGFTKVAGGTVTATNGRGTDVLNEYVSSAFAVGGAAWHINQLRAGGNTATSFTKAFVDIKVSEIEEQNPAGVPEPSTLFLFALGLLGAARMRRVA